MCAPQGPWSRVQACGSMLKGGSLLRLMSPAEHRSRAVPALQAGPSCQAGLQFASLSCSLGVNRTSVPDGLLILPWLPLLTGVPQTRILSSNSIAVAPLPGQKHRAKPHSPPSAQTPSASLHGQSAEPPTRKPWGSMRAPASRRPTYKQLQACHSWAAPGRAALCCMLATCCSQRGSMGAPVPPVRFTGLADHDVSLPPAHCPTPLFQPALKHRPPVITVCRGTHLGVAGPSPRG